MKLDWSIKDGEAVITLMPETEADQLACAYMKNSLGYITIDKEEWYDATSKCKYVTIRCLHEKKEKE